MSDPKLAAFKVPPVEKTVLVACSPERAFQAFTAEIAAWWPLATHSVNQAKAKSVRIEPVIGGRVVETTEDGSECEWGRILTWSPPDAFSMTWHPGRGPDSQQVVALSFIAEAGATRVRLIHRGWEVLGDRAQAMRDSYNGGWETVFIHAFGGYLGHAS